MADVEFNDESKGLDESILLAVEHNKAKGGMTVMLVQSGLVVSEMSARMALLLLALCFFVIAFFVYSYTQKHAGTVTDAKNYQTVDQAMYVSPNKLVPLPPTSAQ